MGWVNEKGRRRLESRGGAGYKFAMMSRESSRKTLSGLAQRDLLERRLLGETFKNQRDAVALALGRLGQDFWRKNAGLAEWERALTLISPPRKGRRYSYMDGRTFLSFQEALAATKRASEQGEEFVIFSGMLGGNTMWWRELPRATVIGSVNLAKCPNLESIDLTVLGDLHISHCPKLRRIGGEVFGSTHIASCGLETVGADFRAGGSLDIHGCQGLRLLNCEVSGNFQHSGCEEVRFGPAFISKNHRGSPRRAALSRGKSTTAPETDFGGRQL